MESAANAKKESPKKEWRQLVNFTAALQQEWATDTNNRTGVIWFHPSNGDKDTLATDSSGADHTRNPRTVLEVVVLEAAGADEVAEQVAEDAADLLLTKAEFLLVPPRRLNLFQSEKGKNQ